MDITDVSIKTVTEEGKVKAYCRITFDECFVVKNIRILEKDDGSFMVCMPSIKSKTNVYFDVCYPNNAQMRKKIDTVILTALMGQMKATVIPPSIPLTSSGTHGQKS